jgi:hypothetical protein
MMCAVKRRTDKLGKAGIYNDEFFDRSLLYVEDLCYQPSALGNHGASEFEMELLTFTQLQTGSENVEVAFKVGNGVLFGIIVIDSQTSSHVDAFQCYALGFKLILQMVDLLAELNERFGVKYL